MNRWHDTALDLSILVQRCCHRSQAVGCARSCRDNGICGSQCLVIYVVNDGWEIISCRSWDNNLLSTSLQVSRSLSFWSVETCALKYNVYAQLTPRKFCCIWLCINCDFLTINSDRSRRNNSFAIFAKNCILIAYSVLTFTIFACETTLSSVILQEVCKHFWACQVVDSNNFITFSLKHLTECEATDTAETVNSYFCHFYFLFL